MTFNINPMSSSSNHNLIRTKLVVCVAQDVTENALNDQALAAAATDLRLLVNTANAPIFGVDIKGNVNIWNRKTVELTGYSKEEVMEKPVELFFREDVKEVFEKTLQGVEVNNFQIQFTSRHGDVRHLMINFSCRRHSEGDVITGGLAVCQDVTENELHDR